jgi:hypothetical protein
MIKVSVTHPVRRLGQLDMAVGRTPSGGPHPYWSKTLGLVVFQGLLEAIPAQEAILRRARGWAFWEPPRPPGLYSADWGIPILSWHVGPEKPMISPYP